MNEHLESEFIGRIAQLQFLNRSKSYQLKLGHRIGRPRSEQLFENLQTLLTINLKEYAQGKQPFPHDAQQRLQRLEVDLICTRLFCKRHSDVKVAKSILAAIIFDQLDNLSISRNEQMPIEFRNPTWMNLYRTINPPDRQLDGQFSLGDARRIFRFVQKVEQKDRAVSRVLLGVMTFIANRFHFSQSQQMLLDFIEIAKLDRQLFRKLTDPDLLKKIVQHHGSAGICHWLESVFKLHACREWLGGFGRTMSHLMKEILCWSELQKALENLQRLADYEGISEELIHLLQRTTGEQKMRDLLDFFTVKAGPLSMDAQHICYRLLKAQPEMADALLPFSKDIARIGLDPPLKWRLIKSIRRDQKFAQHLAARRLETDGLIKKFQQASSVELQFFWLILIALQNLKGENLEHTTRAISMLYRLKRSAKIDEQHYALMMRFLSEGLPTSLEQLQDHDNGCDKLRYLFGALHDAAQDLHSGKITRYFVDAV
jgi:hypothetical protein